MWYIQHVVVSGVHHHCFIVLPVIGKSLTHNFIIFLLFYFLVFSPNGPLLLFLRLWAGEMRRSRRPPVWLQAGGQGSLCRQHCVVQLWPGLHAERSRGSHLPAGGEKSVGQPPPSLHRWVGSQLFVCETHRVCAKFFIQLQVGFQSAAAFASAAASKRFEIHENQSNKGSQHQDAKCGCIYQRVCL